MRPGAVKAACANEDDGSATLPISTAAATAIVGLTITLPS
jgi:hypothetical protein